MPEDTLKLTNGHRTEETEGGKYPRSFSREQLLLRIQNLPNTEIPRTYIPKTEAESKAWLKWKSNRCEHGLKKHQVNPDGTIQENKDPLPSPCKKPKAISSRQFKFYSK